MVVTLSIPLVIVLIRTVGGPGAAGGLSVDIPDPASDTFPSPAVVSSAPPPDFDTESRRSRAARGNRTGPLSPARTVTPKPSWVEVEDRGPEPGDPVPISANLKESRLHLPEWTRTPAPDGADGPFVVVRRVAEVTDGQTEPTLHFALDQHIGGTVELADQGPLPLDDLRMSGESRVIRARRGYRPIIRILRSRTEKARENSAFLPLDRKTLTLEGVDLIVDASDLSGRQTALFGCVGASLTLRDCTVTVLNPTGARFVLVRQDPSARPSRIRLERTLVRGGFSAVAELAGGPVDLVLDGTAILGGIGPVVKVTRVDAGSEPRIFFAGALLASPGPIVQCDAAAGPAATGRLAIRSYGSAFGRLQAQGIASFVSMADPDAVAERRVAWSGDRNLFAGWMGFFARGTDPTITLGNLSKVRSTWNATEQGSLEIPPAWVLSLEPARVTPFVLDPFLPDDRKSLLAESARPGPGLFPKTIDGYLDPPIPVISAWASAERAAGFVRPGQGPRKLLAYDPKQGALVGPSGAGPVIMPSQMVPGSVAPGAVDSPDLTLDTANSRWGGDLGAFLRDQVPPQARHLRVRVVGSGAHRFTPVRLPEGLTLEIRVDPAPGAEPLSWSPDPRSSGQGLLEVHGGALVLANVILHHDPDSGVKSLIEVNDAHLVLFRCQLTVPPGSGNLSGDLIVFRAPTTRPMPDRQGGSPFQYPVDRPVCRLIDTILIANRTAVRAELGRGLIAMTRCAVASDETAIELDPATVARGAFSADLWLERCTMVSGRSIIRLGHWGGKSPGPDRPWLVSSRHCAFVTLSDPRAREAVLLRVDADAMAGGCLFWQADGDAYDLDQVTAAGEVALPPSRSRDLWNQWAQFWGSSRFGRITGPRGGGFRFRERPRPGQIEPPDLLLDAANPAQQGRPDVGADLASLGIAPRAARPVVPRN